MTPRFADTSLPDDADRRPGWTLEDAIRDVTKWLTDHWTVPHASMTLTIEDGKAAFEERVGVVLNQTIKPEVVVP